MKGGPGNRTSTDTGTPMYSALTFIEIVHLLYERSL